MYDHRHLRPKKVSWLYSATLGPFGLVTRAIQYVTVWILIKAKRYKPQLGNSEVPREWRHANAAVSDTHFKAPGMNVAAHSAPAVSTPAITRVTIGDDFDSDIQRESPNAEVSGDRRESAGLPS